ncbi:winged helix-turn-helix domain-containing protein [Nitrosopumilus sp.]|uniref:winged helix-turn-helix domain-containing protein n=1 Tax=Nitrosopumilus sp. TaxID=2024843 RepID=UPI0029314557|nr:winged helix-turn-helix domain-containing protein [Nitrosopumilus sp.]
MASKDLKKGHVSLHLLSDTDNQTANETLIKILAEKATRKILLLLQEKPKTISEISKESKFSANLIYSKIRVLENLNLLYVSGNDINKDWKKKFHYQSKIKSFDLRFENGKIDLKIIYNKIAQKKKNTEKM